MFNKLKNLDIFTRNIIVVFVGTSLANFLNLLYQLLIAHKLSPADFAAFNSLLSILMLTAVPLGTLQTAIAKYSSEFNAHGQIKKIQVLLSGLFRKSLFLAIFLFSVFYFASFYIMDKLKIPSTSSGLILALLLGISCIGPVLLGGLQGLELFKWLISASVITGVLKLTLAFIFIQLGLNVAGALGAFLASSIIGLFIYLFPLRSFLHIETIEEEINFKEIFLYLSPVALSFFCFTILISFDMVLVKYFFIPQDSGIYSLAQMVGKIFLFLPGAISIVMFPKIAGLNAKNMDTISTLKRSLLYAGILCMIACLVYNTFPALVLKLLTGKFFFKSIILGRLFSISMSFFALLYILIAYFLSKKDLRFIKFLVLFTLLQFLAIVLWHNSLIQVQLILCINSILLFCTHLVLAYRK